MPLKRLVRWLVVLAAGVLLLRVTLGGGERLADPTDTPVLPPDTLQTVADLPYPPGNVAVSRTGRVFFTFHPEGDPQFHLAELVDGKAVPYPDEAMQRARAGAPGFETPLAVRIDQQNRLWVLDYGHYGIGGQPRLFAFDLATNKLIDSYAFPSAVAGMLSMVNDFQVDPKGRKIYIAETSIFRRTPAILIYDVENRTCRRVLDRDASVMPKDVLINAAGRDMTALWGLVTLKIGVDSITLDPAGEWLYYGPVSDSRIYRIRTADLNDESLDAAALGQKVEIYGRKPVSDGISMDAEKNLYFSDIEHSAILQLRPDHKLLTLAKDPLLRWPDGMSFGPDGWLYVTCSALHQIILKRSADRGGHAPYQIVRLRPGPLGIPGH